MLCVVAKCCRNWSYTVYGILPSSNTVSLLLNMWFQNPVKNIFSASLHNVPNVQQLYSTLIFQSVIPAVAFPDRHTFFLPVLLALSTIIMVTVFDWDTVAKSDNWQFWKLFFDILVNFFSKRIHFFYNSSNQFSSANCLIPFLSVFLKRS